MQINFKKRDSARALVKARNENGHFAKLVDKGTQAEGRRWAVALRPTAVAAS